MVYCQSKKFFYFLGKGMLEVGSLYKRKDCECCLYTKGQGQTLVIKTGDIVTVLKVGPKENDPGTYSCLILTLNGECGEYFCVEGAAAAFWERL